MLQSGHFLQEWLGLAPAAGKHKYMGIEPGLGDGFSASQARNPLRVDYLRGGPRQARDGRQTSKTNGAAKIAASPVRVL